MRAALFLAGRHLWHRKLLHGIAVLGVTLGVLTLVAITGIMRGFQGRFLDTILQVSPHVVLTGTRLGAPRPPIEQLLGGVPGVARVVRQRPSDRALRVDRPTEVTAALAALPGVVAVAPLVVGSAVVAAGSRERAIELRGIDPAAQDRVTPLRARVVAGRYDDLGGGQDGAMLGVQLAADLGLALGDRLACASARGETIALRVVALFETGVAALDKGRAYVPLRLARAALGRGELVDRLELRLADPAEAPALVARLEAWLGDDAESWQEVNAAMLGVFDQQNLITGMIIAAVLLVGGFGILAIQIMIVLDKRRDIALLKSVGYRARDVLAIFLLEGAAVSALGAVLGGALGHYVLAAMRRVPAASGLGYSRPQTFAVYERPLVYALAFAFALAVGVLASLPPAWRASRVEPVDILRGG